MPSADLARLHVFHAEEPLLVREDLLALKEQLSLNEADAFDLTEFDGVDATSDDIIGAVSTAPFLAERRVVIVHRANRLDKDDAESLANKLGSLPATGLLVLVFDPPEDARKVSAGLRSLLAAAKKHGVDKTSALKDLRGELISRTKAFGASLTPKGAALMQEMSSLSLSRAIPELEKCAIYVGANGTIDEEVVRRVAVASREYKVFEMMDFLVRGQLGPALKQLRTLYEDTPKPEEAAMARILPLLHRQVRLIWQARAASERLPKQSYEPKQKGLSTMHSYAKEKASTFARSLNYEQLRDMMSAVADTDLRLKGQLPAANPGESVERLIAELCEIAKRKSS